VAFSSLYIDGYGAGFFMTAFGYSLVAWTFSILVMAALSPNSLLARVRAPGAYHIALWSYSIYLSHKAVAYIMQGYAQQAGLSAATTLVAIASLSVLVGAVLYRFVETPFMVLRQRLSPSSFKRELLQPAPVA
jgi:peptidoglycan/LPS O-acetylase OafA/YrhL